MSDDQHEWVDLREASRRLGRSTETIRRQIRAGTFEHPAEREQRAPGDTRDRYKVRLPKAPDTPQATPHEALPPYPDLREALAVLERQFDAQRAADASQRAVDASVIRDQAEQLGALKAERDALQARVEALSRPWWRFWSD